MSLIKGIDDYSKACMLIALKDLFDSEPYYGQVDWGEDFLVDFFLEFGDDGFNSYYNYLIEESAPVILLQCGTFRIIHYQGDDYVEIIHWEAETRYRLPRKRNVVLSYGFDDNINGHAVCISANRINEYLQKYKFVALLLPKYGLIVDHIRKEG